MNFEKPVLPNNSNIINILNDDMTFLHNEPESITISINYKNICEKLLRICKRTECGFISDESLIDGCMELERENDGAKI